MKLTSEQFDDMIATGEAKTVKTEARIDIYLIHREDPEIWEQDDETKKPTKWGQSLGYIIEFYPDEDMKTRLYYQTKTEENGEWEPEIGLEIGVSEIDFETDFTIIYRKQTYNSWESFATAFGITELIPFATKLPTPVAKRFKKICGNNGETPSSRIRSLVEAYIEEKIRSEVRRVMFEE